MIDRSKLYALIESYWKDFRLKSDCPVVVKPSLPIIWFGDIERYSESELKIVTVGLNPSDAEFTNAKYHNKKKGEHSFLRFPESERIANNKELNRNNTDMIFDSLSDYFKIEPYGWFYEYEKILEILGASFGGKFDPEGKYKNCAVHIDLFSAIATSPTWSGLNKESKAFLNSVPLCFKLLEFLNPDVILISCDHSSFEKNFKDYVHEYSFWKIGKGSEKKKSYDYLEIPRSTKNKKIYRIEKYKNEDRTLIWGPYASNAFAYFSDAMKNEIFSEIRNDILGQ